MTNPRQISLAAPARIRKAKACDAIYKLMDGKEWNADTLDAICVELENAGYDVHGSDDVGEG